MIVLSSVTKIFKKKTAVDGISLKAKEGEIIGFLGPNGAGKTTTMRLILGYLTPTMGSVLIDNLHPIDNRIEVLRRIGYLPENNPLYQEMKVDEYLQFISSVKAADSYINIAENVGLKEVLTSKIEELSRGYKQRVGLAAALLGDPQILILDEPTSGLDPLEQEKIRELIKKLANPTSSRLRGAKKKTIIFSTHILSEVEEVANRLIIIDNGKIVYDGIKPRGRGKVEKLFKKLVK
ncbi:ABC transporter ATP-binding protein [Candidatus Roizmanbacteria bacterium]|nr:ABC transporter ATP-binding protein [Candidatus Roizmanbacteria bacterium]